MDPPAIPMSVDLSTTYGALLLGNILAIGFWFLQIFQTYVELLDFMWSSRALLTRYHTQGLLLP
jgi:hypothetical protein